MSNLIDNLDKIHTTAMGAERVARNIGIKSDEVIAWCKKAIKAADVIFGLGKNWYAYKNGVAITINATSFTIITAHKIKAKIRTMTPDDYEVLPEFLYQAIYIPKGAEMPPRSLVSEPEIAVYIKDFGMQAGDLGVVAQLNGQIVGAAWTRIIPPQLSHVCVGVGEDSAATQPAKEVRGYGHLDNDTPELAISLLPEFRSCGIGSQLMKKLFVLLQDNGYKQTSLSVQKDNPAVRFYQRLGYKKTGDRLDHAGHEDWLMVKELI